MTPQQRAKRLHYHLYESCEGIREQSERIVKLEELVMDYDKMLAIAAKERDVVLPLESVLNALRIRMYELGIEVEE